MVLNSYLTKTKHVKARPDRRNKVIKRSPRCARTITTDAHYYTKAHNRSHLSAASARVLFTNQCNRPALFQQYRIINRYSRCRPRQHSGTVAAPGYRPVTELTAPIDIPCYLDYRFQSESPYVSEWVICDVSVVNSTSLDGSVTIHTVL